MKPARPLLGDLIGRDAELSTTSAMLESRVRLLTLTGPPGVGKTRLADELAVRCAGMFRDGVVLVDLTPCLDWSAGLDQLARAVGLDGPAQGDLAGRVHRWLRDRETLLVLDNAEQVDGLAVELAALLHAAPRVQLLVTSRENMHLSQEHEFPVPPLAMPGPGDLHDLDRLRRVAAVALFVAAARAARPEFDVSPDNAAAVAEICRRLDGLPLSLTLAAPRVKLFSPGDMAARLSDRRAILEATAKDVTARHRSLRAAISWSHALLTAEERTLFRRLSVFATSWTLHQAERVCGQPGADVVDTLSSLLDKSLVQQLLLDSPEARFVMLQSIREYAAEQLAASDDRASVEARYAELFVDASRRSEASVGTVEEQHWRDWAARHEADLRVIRGRALEDGDLDGALRLSAATGWSCYTHGHLGTGRSLVEEVLAHAEAATPPPDPDALRAARIVAGVLAWAVGDLDRADALLESALASSRDRDDDRHSAMALAFLGHVARDRGDFATATRAHEEGREIYDRLGNGRGSAWARFDLGRVAWQRGDLDAAASLLREALARFRRVDYQWAAAWAGWALGTVLVSRADADAAPVLATALTEFERAEDLRGSALCWESLAVLAATGPRTAEAVRLLGAAAAVREQLGSPRTGAELARVDAALAVARGTLGDHGQDQATRDGQTMPTVAAFDLAHELAESVSPTEPVVPGPGWSALTGREQEVARLVADGCTNQQVGRRLGITVRTAEAHLHNIMGKLGARSRSEVAVWVVTQAPGRAPAAPYVVSPMAPPGRDRVHPKDP